MKLLTKLTYLAIGCFLIGCSTVKPQQNIKSVSFKETFVEFDLKSINVNGQTNTYHDIATFDNNNLSKISFAKGVVYVKNINESGNVTTITSGLVNLGLNFNLVKNEDNSINVTMNGDLLSNYSMNKNGTQKLSTITQVETFNMSKESNIVYFNPIKLKENQKLDSEFSVYNKYEIQIKYLFNDDQNNFNYSLSKNTDISSVFDNGQLTFIKFNDNPQNYIVSILDSNGDNTLLNYRIFKNYLIIDRKLSLGQYFVLKNIENNEIIKIKSGK